LEANPGLPPEVERVIRRALSKNPDQRFASCGEFSDALEQALLPPAPPTRRTVAPAPRINKRYLIFIGVLLVIAATGYFLTRIPARDAAKTAPVEVAKSPGSPAVEPPASVATGESKTVNPQDDDEPGYPEKGPHEPARHWWLPWRRSPQYHPPQQHPNDGTSSDKWQNPKDGLIYVWVPAGDFMMGCSPGDNECDDDEKPPHAERIANGFWIGQTEVTQAAWTKLNIGPNPSHFKADKGDQLPVESVDWKQARDYCKAIGGRLPTEKEWEYAARGRSTGARYGAPDSIAWYRDNSGSKTHPVGLKEPNAYGLYDLLGNVPEWTSNKYDDRTRVVRGGSWGDPIGSVRASYRSGFVAAAQTSGDIGFRCAGEFR
jgi:formylglycine-generating enzyme required for sulfatase activity